jgi:hypothetical protein
VSSAVSPAARIVAPRAHGIGGRLLELWVATSTSSSASAGGHCHDSALSS